MAEFNCFNKNRQTFDKIEKPSKAASRILR